MNRIKGLWMVSGLMSAVALSACGEAPADESVAVGEKLSFESQDDALAWLAPRAADRPGTHVVADATGKVRSITFDDESARDSLLAEFDRFKVVRVAGTDYPTGEEARVAALTSGIPEARGACNGPMCLASMAINRHWSVFGVGFHEVAGRSDITAGSTKTYYCPSYVPPSLLDTTVPRGAPLSNTRCASGWTLSSDPDYSSICSRVPGGSPFGYSCVKRSGTQSLGVAVTYFSNTTDCGSGHCVTTPMAIRTDQGFNSGQDHLKVGVSALGYFTLGCTNAYGPAECYVDGVCVSSSGSVNANSAQTSTAAGSYDCPGF